MTFLLPLHVLAAIVWIGGMFFALQVLRPASGKLEPGIRLPLWNCVFIRFFPWVWAAIVLLPVTGYWMVLIRWGNLMTLPLHVHLMQGIGWLMILVYLYLWFFPYRRFRHAVQMNDLQAAAADLNRIRVLISINLALGILVVIVGASGRFW